MASETSTSSPCHTINLEQLQDEPNDRDEPDQVENRELLISAVRARRILYDASSNSNRNKYLKEQSWSAVANEVNLTGTLSISTNNQLVKLEVL
jgi:Alcohol dehydrogenase transcription factor Myb/SANT-like